MKLRLRPLLVLASLLVISALFVLQRGQAVLVSAASYSGLARIDGELQLDLIVSPPIGAPRDNLELKVVLTNYSDELASPNVSLKLPFNLQPDVGRLPAGATINLSSNSIEWLALVPGKNGTKEMVLPLKVALADLKQPEQTITAVLKHRESERSASAVVWIGVPPRISGLNNSQRISVAQPIQLQIDATGPGPLSEVWDLGDGRRIPLNSPIIVYPKAGVYDVEVTVSNPIGRATHQSTITVVPHAVAQFKPEDDTPGIGESILFFNESGGQSPMNFTWDFGDGTQSNETEPQHTFNAPGIYSVRLLIENAFGQSETTSLVTVGEPPSANIMVEENSPAGELIAGQVVGNSVDVQYAWEMGDGRTYDGTKIKHAYRHSGDYYVTLKASNEFGTTEVGRWVHVEPGILKVYMPIINYLSGLSSGSSVDTANSTIDAAQETPNLDAPFVMEPLELAQTKAPIGQLLLYINEARRHFDLPALTESSNLSAAAHQHTTDMAGTQHTQHTGSDGSAPAERQLWYGYTQGYAGEATAWGFVDPRQAVEFWVNSPSHRPIILNPFATEVGVGYTVDYDAPSVWYWTAEFGNSFTPAEAPSLRVQMPPNNLEALNSDSIVFSWNWSKPLNATEQFSIYFYGSGSPKVVGTIKEPTLGTRFVLPVKLLENPNLIGSLEWQIKLENNRGVVQVESPRYAMQISPDPTLPTATPVPTIVPTIEPTALPTITPTATAIPPSPTPRPTNQPLPPLVTATPMPSQEN